MRKLTRMLIPCLAALVILAGATAYAQTASIAGTILDPSGAGVPEAMVTATNLATAAVRTAVTGTAGTYSIPDVPVGNYDIKVEKTGFTTLTFKAITLTVAQNLTLNGNLEIGAVTQTVEVAGTAIAPINLEDAQISNVVEQRRIVELPLITRDPYQLVLLSPGTQQIPNDGLGGFSVNGQRDRNNNFLLDGVDNNDAGVPGQGTGLSALNPDATQEFRVITNNFLPEFGRNTGAVVDIVTKSGTNEFHGSAYEFNRVNALAARDWFNPSPDPQNPFVRNQFGASVGGPIFKDKTFFFVDGEWDRFRTTLTNQSIVPTAGFKSGVFDYNGEQINLASPSSPNNAQGLPLDPTMQKVLSLYPNPNGPQIDALRAFYFFPTGIPQDAANVIFRLDQHFSDKYSLSARFIYNGNTTGDSLDEIFPGVGGVPQSGQTYNGSLNFVAALRPNLLNEFRFGLNKASVLFSCEGNSIIDQTSSHDAFGFGTDYAFEQSNGVPTISDFGCIGLGDSNSQYRRFGTWNVVDNATWVKGRHTVKAGFEYRYVFENGYTAFGARPVVDFTAFGNFGIQVVNGCSSTCENDEVLQTMAAALLGLPGIQSQTQFFNAKGTRTAVDYRRFVQHEYGAFVQDQWKIRNNLTLSLGLRYEFDGVPFDTGGNLSNLLDQQANAPGDVTFQTVGPGTGRQLYKDDPWNFEPRVGLAWDPFSDGKTSFRMGYGIFHDRIFGNLFGNVRADPPFEGTFQNFPQTNGPNLVTLATLPPPDTLPSPSATIPDGSLVQGLVLLDPNLKTPYNQSWNVGIQRDLGHGISLEVNYVGAGSHRLPRSVDANPPLPNLVAAAQASGEISKTTSGGILRLLPLLGLDPVTGNSATVEPILIKSLGNSTYNGLQTTVRKRLSYGLDLQASYTWSHAIDDAADPILAPGGNRNIARNSFNLKEDRGTSDYDLRHRLIVNYLYEFPFGKGHALFNHGAAERIFGGWEIAGLSVFQSGHPFDIYSSRDSEYTGLTNRPDLVGNPNIPPGSPRNQVGPPFAAFTRQPFGRPGNLGRNTFTGPRYYNTDASLIKNTKITEKVSAQFRAEVFNVFNRIQFDNPTSSSNTISSPDTFGLSTNTINQPDGTTSARQIQLALKVIF